MGFRMVVYWVGDLFHEAAFLKGVIEVEEAFNLNYGTSE
jgi:hypothetical protein